jgi:flagellar hook-basal body complex protein FliE
MNTIQGITGTLPGADSARRTDNSVRPSFKDTLSSFVKGVNSELQEADQKMAEFAVGESQDLHEIMITSEKAGISFKLLMEIRNHLLEAYQEIMRMQF